MWEVNVFKSVLNALKFFAKQLPLTQEIYLKFMKNLSVTSLKETIFTFHSTGRSVLYLGFAESFKTNSVSLF